MSMCGEASVQAVVSHERCVRKRNLWVVCKNSAGPFMLELRAVEVSNLNIWRLYSDASYLTENVEMALLQLALLHIQIQRDF